MQQTTTRRVPLATRRTSGKRRMIDPVTCERDYSPDEVAFMRAVDEYKRRRRRPFPTWSEVLEVLGARGYRKVAGPGDLPGGAEVLELDGLRLTVPQWAERLGVSPDALETRLRRGWPLREALTCPPGPRGARRLAPPPPPTSGPTLPTERVLALRDAARGWAGRAQTPGLVEVLADYVEELTGALLRERGIEPGAQAA